MMDIKGAIDAPKDYVITLSSKEGKKASARACRHLKPRDPGNCYGARIIRFLDPNVEEVHIYLDRSFILFKGQEKPWRYINSSIMGKIARLNDQQGRGGVLKMLRLLQSWEDEIQEVILYSPYRRVNTSLEYLRSDEFREKRRANGEKNKRKKIRRHYTSPKAVGLRSGQGLSHSWGTR